MKKCYWLIGLFCLQLALAYSIPAFTLGADVIITTGNEQYNMSSTLPFSRIVMSTNYVIFNSTGFYIVAPNPINISLVYLSNNFADPVDEEEMMEIDADTTSGTVTFAFSGYPTGSEYVIKRDTTTIATPEVIAGLLSFTNAVWSNHSFIVEYSAPAASGSSNGLNGTDFINNPFNIVFKPWTDIFENVTGYGGAFWLFLLVVFTFAVYIKTQKPEVAMLFMIGSGAFFSTSSAFVGAGDVTMAFIIFTAIGLTGLFIKLIYFRGE